MNEIRADVIVVGAGIAGALAATELARSGVSIVLLESGTRVDRAQAVQLFRQSSARVPEAPYPSLAYAPQPTVLDLKGYYVEEGPEPFGSTYERCVGGSTWHWLGTALRLIPSDFKMKRRYGVGVDWPISYDDLEPWYGRAEREIGVAGADDPALGAPRSRPYPMPPIPQSYLDGLVAAAAESIGLQITATPQARNSRVWDGRPACCGNATCVPICPIGAKYDASVHVAKAEKLGAQVVAPAIVHEVDVRGDGVTARFLRPDRTRGVVRARTLILAAHAIETPKLMLLSRGPEHRAGLGNERDLVGRFLMDHPVQLSWALTPEPLYPFRGPLSTSGIETLRDGPFRARRSAFRVKIGNDGWSWPAGDATVQAYTQATNHRLGEAGLAELRNRFARQLRLASLTEPLPDPRNRVTLAEQRDALGIPRPTLSDRTGDYARGGLAAGRETHQRLFERLGATDVNHADQPVRRRPHHGHVPHGCRPAHLGRRRRAESARPSQLLRNQHRRLPDGRNRQPDPDTGRARPPGRRCNSPITQHVLSGMDHVTIHFDTRERLDAVVRRLEDVERLGDAYRTRPVRKRARSHRLMAEGEYVVTDNPGESRYEMLRDGDILGSSAFPPTTASSSSRGSKRLARTAIATPRRSPSASNAPAGSSPPPHCSSRSSPAPSSAPRSSSPKKSGSASPRPSFSTRGSFALCSSPPSCSYSGAGQLRLGKLVRRTLDARHDRREVIADPHAPYFGAELSEQTLVPGNDARLSETRFEDWLNHSLTGQHARFGGNS